MREIGEAVVMIPNGTLMFPMPGTDCTYIKVCDRGGKEVQRFNVEVEGAAFMKMMTAVLKELYCGLPPLQGIPGRMPRRFGTH